MDDGPAYTPPGVTGFVTCPGVIDDVPDGDVDGVVAGIVGELAGITLMASDPDDAGDGDDDDGYVFCNEITPSESDRRIFIFPLARGFTATASR